MCKNKGRRDNSKLITFQVCDFEWPRIELDIVDLLFQMLIHGDSNVSYFVLKTDISIMTRCLGPPKS